MSEYISIERINSIINITLTRPQVLNALNLDMIRSIYNKIHLWNEDKYILGVVISGEGEKAFCAGGDIVSIYKSRGDSNLLSKNFFKEEYILNVAIKNFSKPWISLLDGVSMGGGLGLAVHGSHRIATENTLAGMPETSIGLFPDVGGGYFLSRMKGEIGTYLALTGTRLNAEDCIYSGIANNYILNKDLKRVLIELKTLPINSDVSQIDKILKKYNIHYGTSSLEIIENQVNTNFRFNSILEIMKSLKKTNTDWSLKIFDILSKKSPTSLAITLKQIRLAKNMNFKECMIMEYRMSQGCMSGNDFYEGVRANLVDKDHSPKWVPDKIEDVTDNDINNYFKSLKDRDLFYDAKERI